MAMSTDLCSICSQARDYLAVTTVSGVTISGNSDTGRKVTETAPAITVTSEITIATIGRLMKNLAISRSFLQLLGLDGLYGRAGCCPKLYDGSRQQPARPYKIRTESKR